MKLLKAALNVILWPFKKMIEFAKLVLCKLFGRFCPKTKMEVKDKEKDNKETKEDLSKPKTKKVIEKKVHTKDKVKKAKKDK